MSIESDEAAVRAIVADTFGSKVESAELVPGQGTVNVTFHVKAECEYAVRLNRSRGVAEALLEYEKERWCSDLARSVGIPTPAVLTLGRSNERAFVVHEWVDGSVAPDQPETYRQLGQYVSRLSAIRAEAPAELFPSPFAGWRGQVEHNIGALTDDDPLIHLGVYRLSEQQEIRRAFEWLSRHDFERGLAHGDLSPLNLIVRDGGDPVLIDWGCASFDVLPIAPINDIRRDRLHGGAPSEECLREFVHGLGWSWERCRIEERALNAWLLLKALDLVRWALDRCSERIGETSQAARRVTLAFLAARLPLGIPAREDTE